MNKKYILIAIVMVAAAATVYMASKFSKHAQDPATIEWHNVSDGMALSHSTNKKILMDVYTDWCTWCKKMDKETYSKGEIASYISDHFIPVRLNAESQQMRLFDTVHITDADLASAFHVTGYPTTIFIQSDGKPITSLPGYVETDEFKNVLRYIAEDAYMKMGYDDFKKGIR